MKNPTTPLDEEELELLNDFLLERIDEESVEAGMDEGIFDISTLDGFFTAIVSGPEMIPPSQWLPWLWGDFEPVWEEMEDFELVIGLLMRHMNSIADALMNYPEEFEPMFLERRVEGETYTIVDEWCEGYLRGVALTAEQWRAGGDDMAERLMPIYAFTEVGDWKGHDYGPDEIEGLHQAIIANVREIHAFWLARRSDAPLKNTPQRRDEPRIGRNDPCPCGSGKKYKKCCLH